MYRTVMDTRTETYLQQLKSASKITGFSPGPYFKGNLYEFQKKGASFMHLAKTALVADDVGLGKTIEALAAINLGKQSGKINRTLIVSPSTLKWQWASEIKKFTYLTSTVIGGDQPTRSKLYSNDCDVTIMNYELFLRDIELLHQEYFDTIILDEASRIKNPNAQIATIIKSYARRSKRRYALTATPIENNLQDIFSIMQFIEPKAMGPLLDFHMRHCVFKRMKKYALLVGYKNVPEFRAKVAPYFIRRKLEDVEVELPEVVMNNYEIELTHAQREIYELAKKGILDTLKKCKKINVLTTQVFLREICDHPLLVKQTGASSKLTELAKLLSSELKDRKVVVFTQFKRMAYIICNKFKKQHPLLICSGISDKKRDKIKNIFNSHQKAKLLVATDAANYGLNLPAGEYVINYDLPFNPAVVKQRIGRLRRLTQQHSCVRAINLLARNTIEERVFKVLKEKKLLSENFLDKDVTADLTPEELGALL